MNSLLKLARAGKRVRVLAAVAVLLFSLSLFSQVNTGTISGVVQDSSGAVIGGAMVTIRNVDTGIATALTSDTGGRYVVPNLLIGNYEREPPCGNSSCGPPRLPFPFSSVARCLLPRFPHTRAFPNSPCAHPI